MKESMENKIDDFSFRGKILDQGCVINACQNKIIHNNLLSEVFFQ